MRVKCSPPLLFGVLSSLLLNTKVTATPVSHAIIRLTFKNMADNKRINILDRTQSQTRLRGLMHDILVIAPVIVCMLSPPRSFIVFSSSKMLDLVDSCNTFIRRPTSKRSTLHGPCSSDQATKKGAEFLRDYLNPKTSDVTLVMMRARVDTVRPLTRCGAICEGSMTVTTTACSSMPSTSSSHAALTFLSCSKVRSQAACQALSPSLIILLHSLAVQGRRLLRDW